MSDRTERPVLSGLLALVGVGVAVGLILGLGALVVARMAGIGGGDSGEDGAAEQSMYLPPISKTEQAESSPAATGSSRPADEESSSSSAATAITLTAGQEQVAPMQQIDLTGSYPGGDGAIVQVQRRQGGTWVDFPVTASVSGGTFATYVQTGQTGVNRFRVIDSDSREVSNEVTVRVGG